MTFQGGAGNAAPSVSTEVSALSSEIVLTTGHHGGTMDFEPADGAPSSQSIQPGCPAAVSTGALAITAADGGSPADVCFGTRGLGVNQGGHHYHLIPDVRAEESLSLALAGPAEGARITALSMDIEAQKYGLQSKDLRVVAYDDGAVVGTYDVNLTKGIRVVKHPPNFRVDVELETPAEEVELQPLGKTRFQLEGDTAPTVVSLSGADGVLDCEDGTTGENVYEESGITLTRVDLDADTGECLPLAFTLDRDGEEVAFIKDIADQPFAEFTLTITWDPEPASYPGRVTQIDYLDGEGFQDMVFCDGTAADPVLPGDQIPSTAIEDGWCVADSDPDLVGDGLMQVTETLYGLSDPRFR